MKPSNPFQGITQYFDPLDPNSDPRLPGRPGAGQLPSYLPTQSGAPVNPFAGVMNGMNPAGFARPEAQQWLQQALAAPNMQGWSQPAPGAGGGGAAVPAGGGADAAALGQQVKQASNQYGRAQRTSLYGNLATSLATGGPVGAGISLLTTGLGQLAGLTSNGGWMDTGLDGGYATSLLPKIGYMKGPRGTVRRKDPETGKLGPPVAASSVFGQLFKYIQDNGLTPKMAG